MDDDLSDTLSDSVESDFKSESFVKPTPFPDTRYRLIGKVLELALAFVPAIKAGRFADIGVTFSTFFSGISIFTLLQWIFPSDWIVPSDKVWWGRLGHVARDMSHNCG
jgi:hypothetical protein